MSSHSWSVRSRVALGAALLLMAAVAGAAQREGQPAQGAAGAGRGNFAANFTGTVAVQPTEGTNMSRIRFEAGARTNWHTHTHRQMIWAEEGRGLYQEMGEPVKQLVKDVPILTKANVPHWHGAAPNSHVVQLTIYGGDIKWGAPVTDAEYLGKK